MSDGSDLFVVVKLKGNELGIPVTHVQEMVIIPEVTSVPVNVTYARGMITLRDKAIPLIDLRSLLGFETMDEEQREIIDMLIVREEDHVKWLHELENSVKEEREFKLATDPHKCNFGKWYDNFTTDSLILGSLLPKFDAPHKRIHGIAQEVVDHTAKGQQETALAIIERTRNAELARMIHLFEQAKSIIKENQRELALVLKIGERLIAVSVDLVTSVETLIENTGDDISYQLESLGNGLLRGIAQSKIDDRVILLVDPESIFRHHSNLQAAD